MPAVYIGIGSNLGDRAENCERAIRLLKDKGIETTARSRMIETAPWGVTDQPDFINMAIRTETSLEPEELLKVLKTTEAEMGRRPGERWGPRVIDLDILLYEDRILNLPGLEIPHPQIKDRDFVLKPLTEIAPDYIHPVLKKSVRELLEAL